MNIIMYVVLKKKLHVKMLNLWIINMSVIVLYLNEQLKIDTVDS